MTKRTRYNLIGILGAVLLILADQWTKRLAVTYLKDQAPIVLWKGVFEFHYLENRGAAFGILQGRQGFFLLCTVVVLAAIAYVYHRTPLTSHYRALRIVGVLLTAGAIGNLIDRTRNAYVVDFLYIRLIDFPVFNVADCYVTAGAVLLAILILFVYKDNELTFITPGKKKPGETSEEEGSEKEPGETSKKEDAEKEPGETSKEEDAGKETDETSEEKDAGKEPGETSKEEDAEKEPDETAEEAEPGKEPDETDGGDEEL